MSRAVLDMTGQSIGRLLVLTRNGNATSGEATWDCLCSCGSLVVVKGSALRENQGTRSCGCLSRDQGRKKLQTFRESGRHANYKGGHVTPKGYRIIVGRGSTYYSHRRTVFQHMVVMSEYLGRALLPEENVHHKNGNRSDNRLENLELWSRKQPRGQRVIDKVEWAREILAQYESDIEKGLL